MSGKKENNNIFKNKAAAMFLAASCALAWAFAFPLIKLGTSSFKINDSAGAKSLFAGIRFLAAGAVVLIIAALMKRDFKVKKISNIALIALFGLINTALHYFCFYMGLSVMTGSRSAIIDSMSSFALIVLACICFKSEKMTLRKAAGCLLGLFGVLLVNIGGSSSGEFTFAGDGMLILSVIFSALGGVLTRIVTRRTDPIVATGASLAFGGALMIIAGLAMGAGFKEINLSGIIYLILLIAISVYGFTVYNQLLCYNPVGEIAIFNALIPIMGVILSCIFLGEPFMPKYLLAGVIVAAGVYVINSGGKQGDKK